MLVFLFLVFGALWLLYKYWVGNYNYWKSRGFNYLEPSFPYGNMKDLVHFSRFQGFIYQDIYNRASPYPYVGLFELRRPFLLLRDPEIIKVVMVKDFNNFRNRMRMARKEPLADHLFNQGGDRWKALRVKLTPTFTSGKLKLMFGLFKACSNQLDLLIEDEVSKEKPIDIKDLMAKYTTDTIGSCAFGLDINSITHPDSKFRKIGGLVVRPTPTWDVKIKLAIASIFPDIEKAIKFKMLPDEVSDFMFSVVKETVEFREKNNFRRNDFIDLLIELKNKGKIEDQTDIDESEIKDKTVDASSIEMDMNLMVAQCFIFFIAGFETSSSVQSYCLYEMALNQEIQEKLRREILEAIAKHGDLTYQAIMEMTYLDQVVSETMRKYPTLPILQRFCTKRFVMPDTGSVVEEGTRVIIPTYALHHDPKYFPNPDKFDPDRFLPENKSLIRPYTYLPFGEGPRLCIGMRFGLLQTKVGLCTVLKKYRLKTCSETKIPLQYTSSAVVSSTDGPIKLIMEKY